MTEQELQQYLIKGDVPNPKGGVRGVIPSKQGYSTKKAKEKTLMARKIMKSTTSKNNDS